MFFLSHRSLQLLLGVLLFAFVIPLHAESQADKNTTDINDPGIHNQSNASETIDPDEESDFQDWIDETQDSISDTIHYYGTSFDHYIAKEEDEAPIRNRSYLKIKFKPKYQLKGFNLFLMVTNKYIKPTYRIF